jgi:hypothetical protein
MNGCCRTRRGSGLNPALPAIPRDRSVSDRTVISSESDQLRPILDRFLTPRPLPGKSAPTRRTVENSSLALYCRADWCGTVDRLSTIQELTALRSAPAQDLCVPGRQVQDQKRA